MQTSAALASPNTAAGSGALADWLVSFWRDPRYHQLVSRFDSADAHITPPQETALLYALIQRLQPSRCLEIGTFFAHTARIMAEALAESGGAGRLMTLDPFGEARVPGIIATWPQALQVVTEYRPINSMQYFLELEVQAVPKGAASPFNVIFVDGHHNIEYALFDIIRSADHLAPGGAIMMDNLEQEGPRLACQRFLQWNPAWKLFYQGAMLNAHDLVPEIIRRGEQDILWGVLLAPDGIQVASQAVKLGARGLPYRSLEGVRFHVRDARGTGTLRFNLCYYAVPFDYHCTGKGLELKRFHGAVKASPDSHTLSVAFPHPLTLACAAEASICHEIELAYQGGTEADYLLLEPDVPLTLLPAK